MKWNIEDRCGDHKKKFPEFGRTIIEVEENMVKSIRAMPNLTEPDPDRGNAVTQFGLVTQSKQPDRRELRSHRVNTGSVLSCPLSVKYNLYLYINIYNIFKYI